MARKPLLRAALLLGALLVMALKCTILLRAGARRPHIPEPDER